MLLGGATIPSKFGLHGHVDGDVVLHALMDAMFGAAALPDVRERFPENLEQLGHILRLPVDQLHELGIRIAAGEDDSAATLQQLGSKVMLAHGLADLQEKGWAINNVDLTIMASVPELSPHKALIRSSVAEALGAEWDRVSVKINTHAGIDSVERGRAIACRAAVSLTR
jgi:2-C-methyl-D-erythritol 2,4-cyclodiphosphate synthase